MPDSNPIRVTIHGPYEDAIIAGFEVVKVIVEKQDPASAKECWTRWLDATKGLSDLGAAMSKGLSDALPKIVGGVA